MSKYKAEIVQLNRGVVRDLLQSDQVMNALLDNANKVGDGEVSTNFVGYDRCHVLVRDSNDNRANNS